MDKPTTAQLDAAILAAHTLYTAVASAGAQGIPSGHLYTMTINAFADLDAYESCLRVLIDAGLIKRSNHLLTATEPKT